jgi:HD-GYP domain-containing protein (c-di-GMP phosphodiesterase class II)
MISEDRNIHSEQVLDKEKLKPGYVLNENIVFIPGLRRGLVLSSSDIDQIKKSHKIRRVRVLIQDKSKPIPAFETAPSSSKFKTPRSVKVPVYSDVDLKASIFDPGYADEVKRVVDIKKRYVRGDDYDDRFGRNKLSNFNRFSEGVRRMQAHLRDEASELLEHQAKSATDIDSILSLDGIDLNDLVAKLNRYEQYVEDFLNAAITDKKVYSSYVENIVMDVLQDVGYKLQLALFSATSKSYFFYNFLTSHSLQVLLVSLITAIELSSIIKQKVESFNDEDMDLFMTISKKSFTIEEMINLGIAALLHDVTLKKQIPDLRYNTQLSLTQESVMELHPSNSFHICKNLDLDFEIQRAVYQHHERCDGSGYPGGLLPRFFTKYTPILMFAEYYVEQTTPNPFVKDGRHPREVLVNLLNKQRDEFDGDVVYAFIKAASLFPVGSWVELSNGLVGIVSGFNKNELSKPRLKVFFDTKFNSVKPFEVDLSKEDLKIVRPISNNVINVLDKSLVFAVYNQIA